MFNRVSYVYNAKKKLYTFTGSFGHSISFGIHKLGYSRNKQKYLFEKLNERVIIIHSFFLPDLKFICEALLEVGSEYDVNMSSIQSLLTIINVDIIGGYKSNHKLDMDAIYRDMRYKPLPNQETIYTEYLDVRAMNGSRGMLLTAGVGTGKTYMSLSLSLALHSDVVLIIAPLPTIQRVWVESIAGDKGLLFKHKQQYHVVGDGEYNGEKYIIAHYENLAKLVPLYKEYNINITTLIVDEVHNFNSLKSNRTELLMKLCEVIPFAHAIPMSGTPIRSSAVDLVPILKILSSDFDARALNRFLKVYKGRSGLMGHVLKERYMAYNVSVKKGTSGLPPISTKVVKLKLKNGNDYTLVSISKRLIKYVDDRTAILKRDLKSHQDIYNTLYKQAKELQLANGVAKVEFVDYESDISIIVGAYNNHRLNQVNDEVKRANKFEKTYVEPMLNSYDKERFRNSKTVVKYLDLKVRGEALANVVMRARESVYSELASVSGNLNKLLASTSKKTLVFSQYTKVCKVVVDTASSAKYKPISVFGDSTKDLTRNVNIFINRKEINPLVTTYHSLSTGVPLIQANVILMYGLPWRQSVFDQTVGRIWRVGQDKPTTVYIMELETGDEPNITGRDFHILDWYRQQVADFTGDEDGVVIDREEPINIDVDMDAMYRQEDYLGKGLRAISDVINAWR